jgi:hypothetical protein
MAAIDDEAIMRRFQIGGRGNSRDSTIANQYRLVGQHLLSVYGYNRYVDECRTIARLRGSRSRRN